MMLKISTEDQQWVDTVWEKIKIKMNFVSKKTAGKIPYTTVNGTYDDKFLEDPAWWTNGFWSGILWLMYSETGNEQYKTLAEEVETAWMKFCMDWMEVLKICITMLIHVDATKCSQLQTNM